MNSLHVVPLCPLPFPAFPVTRSPVSFLGNAGSTLGEPSEMEYKLLFLTWPSPASEGNRRYVCR